MEELLSRMFPLDDAGEASSPEEIDAVVDDSAAAAGRALLADLEEALILMAAMALTKEDVETEGWC